ncbi:MAG TPA: cation-translocating P-type ATPase C-terminal domain-containing protein, partial [Flavobacterium sp.]|nr:cation-translocating P-type ATPase C-terminal domain-containing protein [Flavobacterium sp.]
PKEEGLLNGKFFLSNKYLLDAQMVKRMFVMAIPMMIGSLILFRTNYQADIVKAWTITLTTMAIFQWFNAWNCRHESKSIFQMSFTNNQVLLASTGLVILLQIFAVYTPFMQRYLHTTNLSLQDWLLSTLMASTIIVAEEIRKYFQRRGARKTRRPNSPISHKRSLKNKSSD